MSPRLSQRNARRDESELVDHGLKSLQLAVLKISTDPERSPGSRLYGMIESQQKLQIFVIEISIQGDEIGKTWAQNSLPALIEAEDCSVDISLRSMREKFQCREVCR